MDWHDLTISLPTRQIVRNATGALTPGRLSLLLGPSGCGKTTLVSTLVRPSSRLSAVGYVTRPPGGVGLCGQSDVLVSTDTVKESIHFACALRTNLDCRGRAAVVDSVVQSLNLTSCQNTAIGDERVRGVSGGERRRVAVALELVTNKTCIIFDEPTTGLDSYASFMLLSNLREMCQTKNASVMCVLHQPSSSMFKMCDDLYVMDSFGNTVYSGPGEQLVEYLASLGHEIPRNTNPADYIIEMVMKCELPPFTGPTPSTLDVSNGDDGKVSPLPSLPPPPPHDVAQSSFLTQLHFLTARECRRNTRDLSPLISRFAISIFLNLLYGLVFLNAARGSAADPSAFRSRAGALTLVTISIMFGTAQAQILAFPSERPVFLREYEAGSYGVFPYVLSKVVFEVPLLLAQILLVYVIIYWMIGFQGSFPLMVLSSWALALASNSTAILIGSAVSDVKTANEFVPVVFVPQLLFSGFFVAIDSIPAFLRWARYLCSLYYALALLTLLEFTDCEPGAAEFNCKKYLEDNEVYEDLAWFYALMLIVFIVVLRGIAVGVLAYKATWR